MRGSRGQQSPVTLNFSQSHRQGSNQPPEGWGSWLEVTGPPDCPCSVWPGMEEVPDRSRDSCQQSNPHRLQAPKYTALWPQDTEQLSPSAPEETPRTKPSAEKNQGAG